LITLHLNCIGNVVINWADYDVLLKWWNENGYGKHIYIGHGIYRGGSNDAWKNKNQIPEQIQELRKYATTQVAFILAVKHLKKI
jgi:hypothetical protein